MRILVISHTEHYLDTNGRVVGWGPTVMEIDHLADVFGEVVHIACLHSDKIAPTSAIPYQGKNVRFVPIKPFGGRGIKNKWRIIANAWSNIKKVKRELNSADIFQFRAPTSIGLYLIPYLSFFSKKNGWYKYAGNWKQRNAPLSYKLQKWMLLYIQQRKITINGTWKRQRSKCITFENPCIRDVDRIVGKQCMEQREFVQPYRFCFVGRLDKEKGIYKVLEALGGLDNTSIKLDIVGDGQELEGAKKMSRQMRFDIQFHGALSRENIFKIYKNSDFILLPSESEGFPKVIAEAANFGCIPIVSDVSAIKQYVNDSNGFLWDTTSCTFNMVVSAINFNDVEGLKNKSKNAFLMANDFTYKMYIEKLKQYIF